MTLIAVWIESPLLLSAGLVSAFVPQMLWVIDYFFELASWLGLPGPDKELHLTGMTSYMFNTQTSFFLRFLSFFHFWLVFLLIYLVWRVGYDPRGLGLWTVMAWFLLTVCYAWMPPCSPVMDPITKQPLRDPNLPVNINYVYNIASDNEPQTWMEPNLYFATYMAILLVGIYPGTHLLFWWLMPTPPVRRAHPGA
jgi:hypothetical protein